jgi:hypothetical protein
MIVFNLPITGTLQPKVGTINVFPHYGFFELCLSIIMRRLLLIVLGSLFFYCGNSYSADCGDVTVVDCALTSANDEIVIDNDWVDANGKKVTISSTGSIIVDDHDDDGLIRFKQQV